MKKNLFIISILMLAFSFLFISCDTGNSGTPKDDPSVSEPDVPEPDEPEPDVPEVPEPVLESPFSTAQEAIAAIPDLGLSLPSSLASEETSSSRAIYDMSSQTSVKAEGWDNIQGSMEMAQMGASIINMIKEGIPEENLEFNSSIPVDDFCTLIIAPQSETEIQINITTTSGELNELTNGKILIQISMTDLGDDQYETVLWMLTQEGDVIQYSSFNSLSGENSLIYISPSDALDAEIKQIFTLNNGTLFMGQAYDCNVNEISFQQENFAWGNASCGGIEASSSQQGIDYSYSEYYDAAGNMISGDTSLSMTDYSYQQTFYALNYLTLKDAYSSYTLNHDAGTDDTYEVTIINEDGSEETQSFSYKVYDWWLENDGNDTNGDSNDISLKSSYGGNEYIIEKEFFTWDTEHDQYLSLMCNMLCLVGGAESSYFDLNTDAAASITAASAGINENLTTEFKTKLSSFTYPAESVPATTDFPE